MGALVGRCYLTLHYVLLKNGRFVNRPYGYNELFIVDRGPHPAVSTELQMINVAAKLPSHIIQISPQFAEENKTTKTVAKMTHKKKIKMLDKPKSVC